MGAWGSREDFVVLRGCSGGAIDLAQDIHLCNPNATTYGMFW